MGDHRRRLKRQLTHVKVLTSEGPYTARLFLGSVSKYINTLFDDAGVFHDTSLQWTEFLDVFRRKAFDLEKARKAGAGEITIEVEVPLKTKRIVEDISSDSDSASDSEANLDATQTRRKRKSQSKKRQRKGRES